MKRLFVITLFLAALLAGYSMPGRAASIPGRSPEEIKRLEAMCEEYGERYFQSFAQGFGGGGIKGDRRIKWDDPDYHYSQSLNAFLIHIRYAELLPDGVVFYYNQTTDMTANKVVLRGCYYVRPDGYVVKASGADLTKDEYKEAKKKLFKE